MMIFCPARFFARRVVGVTLVCVLTFAPVGGYCAAPSPQSSGSGSSFSMF
jgi:hypothetical protein